MIAAVLAVLAQAASPAQCAPVIGAYGNTLVLRRNGSTITLKVTRTLLAEPLEVTDCSQPAFVIVAFRGQHYLADRWAVRIASSGPTPSTRRTDPRLAGRAVETVTAAPLHCRPPPRTASGVNASLCAAEPDADPDPHGKTATDSTPSKQP